MSSHEEELFHEADLRKIQKAISRWYRGGARKEVADRLRQVEGSIDEAMQLDGQARREALGELLETSTLMRQAALEKGAMSHGNGRWAAAARESWVAALLGKEEGLISSDQLERIEQIVRELMRP